MVKIVKMSREMAQRILGDAPSDKVFWLNDGRVLKNLSELKSALDTMNEQTFSYHAGDSKNDFYNWVKDVITDDKLARDLLRSRSRAEAARAVGDRIAWLQGKVMARVF